LELYGPNSVEFDNAVSLIKNSPILKDPIQTYPIISDKYKVLPYYNKFFVDIICETWYQGQNFFLTEKFWRSVCTRTPFIIHGPQYILTNVKKLGFKTFSDYWDEGYEKDPGYHNLVEIKKIIDYIAEKPMDEIKNMYSDMSEILEHNYNVFMNLTYSDISLSIRR